MPDGSKVTRAAFDEFMKGVAMKAISVQETVEGIKGQLKARSSVAA